MPEILKMKAKVALVGESGVGKTSLIRRFVLNEFDDKYIHTVGTKVSKIVLTVPRETDVEVEANMSIFDIMGQRGFKELVKESFFDGCQGLIAVFDITQKESLEALNDWIATALGVAGDVPVYLAGNKADLIDHRTISDADIERLSNIFGAPHVLTSAKSGENVQEVFSLLAIDIVEAALRVESAKKVEEHLGDKILGLLVRRGVNGADKALFFATFRGINYDELEKVLKRLERDSLVQINWRGPTDFLALLTPAGLEYMKSKAEPKEGASA